MRSKLASAAGAATFLLGVAGKVTAAETVTDPDSIAGRRSKSADRNFFVQAAGSGQRSASFEFPVSSFEREGLDQDIGNTWVVLGGLPKGWGLHNFRGCRFMSLHEAR